MRGTQSTGVSLLFWFAGILYGLSGSHVVVEYGLNVPRYVIDGVEHAVPRSGGDLHYVRWPNKPINSPTPGRLLGCCS